MTLRGVLLAGLAGAVVAALAGSRLLLFAVLAVTALLALALHARAHLFDRVEYVRELSRTRVPFGSEVEVATSIANRKLVPLVWLHVTDAWPAGVEALGGKVRPAPARGGQTLSQTLFVRWYERVRHRYRVRCVERGVHSFGPATMEASDPFGLGGVEQAVATQSTLVVLPKVLDVPGLDVVLGRPLTGVPAARSLARDPSAFVGVRPYAPGDPLRAVNWRATARTGELHSNVWEPTTQAEVVLLLNAQTHRYVYEGMAPDTIELLCVVAASLAAALDGAGFAVGLASNARLARVRGQAVVAPATGALTEILDVLARVIVYPPPPFETLLADELDDVAAAPGDREYLLVTPPLHGDAPRLLAQLAERRPVRIVLVGGRGGAAGEPAAAGSPATAGPAAAPGWPADAVVPADFDWRAADALALA